MQAFGHVLGIKNCRIVMQIHNIDCIKETFAAPQQYGRINRCREHNRQIVTAIYILQTHNRSCCRNP